MSARVTTIIKDPGATLPYGLDFTDWLVDDLASDTIASATWTVPTGLTKESEILTTTKAGVVLSGGTAGATYDVVCHFVTAGGYEDERTLRIYCAQR